MDNTKVEIKTLKIKMGKKEVEITVDEARKLHEVLEQLFGSKVTNEIHHHDHYPWGGGYPWAVPCRPYYFDNTAPSWSTDTVFCNSDINCLELTV